MMTRMLRLSGMLITTLAVMFTGGMAHAQHRTTHVVHRTGHVHHRGGHYYHGHYYRAGTAGYWRSGHWYPAHSHYRHHGHVTAVRRTSYHGHHGYRGHHTARATQYRR